MTDSQGRELTKSMHRSSGSYELVLSAVILAGLGFLIDRSFGTLPIFTAIGAVLGFGGAAVKLYYQYKAEMEEHEAKGPWAKRS